MSRVIVAMDFDSDKQVMDFARAVEPSLCRLKVGKGLFTRYGPALVTALQDMGYDIFLDLKFHDIPHTVAHACRSAAQLGVWMLNVHCFGGYAMMAAAAEAVSGFVRPPFLIGVTVLTSLSDEDLSRLGIEDSAADTTVRLARLAQQAGLQGVVCSGHEASVLREQMGDDFMLVTPGIRPENAEGGDQKRVMTPRQALQAGAHYLVIGRPIWQAPDPAQALRDILSTLA